MSFTLTEGAIAGLDKASKANGMNKSEFLTNYLENLQ